MDKNEEFLNVCTASENSYIFMIFPAVTRISLSTVYKLILGKGIQIFKVYSIAVHTTQTKYIKELLTLMYHHMSWFSHQSLNLHLRNKFALISSRSQYLVYLFVIQSKKHSYVTKAKARVRRFYGTSDVAHANDKYKETLAMAKYLNEHRDIVNLKMITV